MTPGEQNQYDVFIDDELVFSKQREGRWPELADILNKLP
jgi:predicted Rdx family selenoprotein